MSCDLVVTKTRCDLLRLERTNMVAKMEDRVKVDLEAVSRQILGHLREITPESLPCKSEAISRIAVQFNQGSLVQYQYGRIERAEMLCCGEIEFFAELSGRSSHRYLCLANMVPPYINLARIYGQMGQTKESLTIFHEIYRFATQQQDLIVLGHRLRVADAPAIFAAAPSYQKVMLSCRVIDATRVLQTVEDYPAVLELVETTKELPEYQDALFQRYLAEARCRAFLGLGQHQSAMESFTECCERIPANSIDRIVIHSLLSQIYRESGRADSAGETLTKLENHLASLEQLGRKMSVLRQIAYRLALERHLLGDNVGALVPAEKAFRWCTEWQDQPGSIRCAILLLRIFGETTGGAYSVAGHLHWFSELHRLASTTLFRLDRACAYWELGLSADLVNAHERSQQSAWEFLQNSYQLYRSVPFVDSMKSGETLKLLLKSLGCGLEGRDRLSWSDASSVDAAFDALMEHVPKSRASRNAS
jgi:tetratricopeptide (TPR) repeat protein